MNILSKMKKTHITIQTYACKNVKTLWQIWPNGYKFFVQLWWCCSCLQDPSAQGGNFMWDPDACLPCSLNGFHTMIEVVGSCLLLWRWYQLNSLWSSCLRKWGRLGFDTQWLRTKIKRTIHLFKHRLRGPCECWFYLRKFVYCFYTGQRLQRT